MGTEIGEQLGSYRVLGVLRRGAVGDVLRASDQQHDRDVALTVLHPRWSRDAAYRDRFLTAARTAIRLTEPHVLPIHRYGEVEGRLFLDTQLVDGEDVGSLLHHTGPLDPARAVDLVGQVARALDAAHAAGLVHRDVRPANVLLVGRSGGGDPAGDPAGTDVVRLAGLGVPRPAGGTGAPAEDGYLAPEEAIGPEPDRRADVYSLACLLHELLTGRVPTPGPDRAVPAPSSLRPGLPPELDGVVLRGLAPDREQRWTSAGGMAAAARAALALHGIEVARPAERVGAGPVGGGPVGAGRVGAGTAGHAEAVPAGLPGDGPSTRSRAGRRGGRPTVRAWAAATGAVIAGAVVVGAVAGVRHRRSR